MVVREQDWYNSESTDLHDDEAASSSTAQRIKLEQTQLLDRAALLKKQVTAPTEDTKKLARPCPICKEKFKSDWSEAEEDWVFYNAVEVDGTVCSLPLFLLDK